MTDAPCDQQAYISVNPIAVYGKLLDNQARSNSRGVKMQKWEYLYLISVNFVITHINGKLDNEFNVGFLGKVKGKNVFEVLNDLGYQGWEAVGINKNFASERAPATIDILLKRPIS